jgi:hypothetical protein
MDLDPDSGRLVVGTRANWVYVFYQSGSGWLPHSYINGNALGGSFGESVAIDGNGVVVGAPTAKVKYYSTSQGVYSYRLDLGLGSPTYSASTTSSLPSGTSDAVGAAHYYTLSSGYWRYDRLLMPDDPNLPTTTSTYTPKVTADHAGQVLLRI